MSESIATANALVILSRRLEAARLLVSKWRKLADGFDVLDTDIARVEAASMRNDASELEAALTLPDTRENT